MDDGWILDECWIDAGWMLDGCWIDGWMLDGWMDGRRMDVG